MRITGRQLRQIIKEELERTMSEADSSILDQVKTAAKVLKSNMDAQMYNQNPDVGTSRDAQEAWASSIRYGFKTFPASIAGRSHVVIACVAEKPIQMFGLGPFRGTPNQGEMLKKAITDIARSNGLDKLNPEAGFKADRNDVSIYDGDVLRDATGDDMPYSSVWAIPV
jgi:hypothetical protein